MNIRIGNILLQGLRYKGKADISFVSGGATPPMKFPRAVEDLQTPYRARGRK